MGKTISLAHCTKQDGIHAWIALKHKYDADGNTDLRIKRFENIVGTRFDRRYKGGLLQWVQDYENAFVKLIYLGEEAWAKDSSMKHCLLKNAEDTVLNPTVIQSLTKSETFEDACNILCTHAINQDERERENAARKVHNTQTYQSFIDAFTNLSSQDNPLDTSDTATSSFAHLIGQMPVDLWAQLSKDICYWLMQERKGLKQEYVTKTDCHKTSTDTSSTNKDPLPKQYGQTKPANTTSMEDKVCAFHAHSKLDTADHSDDSDDSDDDVLLSLSNKVKTTITHIGIYKERADHAICMLGLSLHEFFPLLTVGQTLPY